MPNIYIISREDLERLLKDRSAKIELGKTDSYQEDAILIIED